jgi:hypothetical protein
MTVFFFWMSCLVTAIAVAVANPSSGLKTLHHSWGFAEAG